MATRRSRIKGVLNIPARRKTGDPTKEIDLIEEDTLQINKSEEASAKIIKNNSTDNKECSAIDRHVEDEIPQKTAGSSSDCVRTVFSVRKLQSTKPTLPESSISGIIKLPATSENAIRTDIEAPSSPTKLNRTRIKAIPRLGQRRISFSVGSASESEDDGRRQLTRKRNDSVCSLTSNVDENRQVTSTSSTAGVADTPTATGGTGGTVPSTSPAKKEFNCVIQRKCRRTEQARKLATAKRDFLHKFGGNNAPDRQRLTMMDLIFYNPATNPMRVDRGKGHASNENKDGAKITFDVEDADDLGTKSEEEMDDPDNQDETIAPQITVNADGEIIIDEKSLLIENKSTVKGRQKLEKANIVDGDENTGYGIYKRVKRTKDWAKTETLRFYKALNTIGTDFSLMAKLFPNRTRRELKMKFKKEERINHALIDKAVLEPVHFDMKDLEADLERELLVEKELELRKKEISLARCVNKQKRHTNSSKSSVLNTKMDDRQIISQHTILIRSENSDNKDTDPKPNQKQKIVKSVLATLNESDDENNTESEPEDEISKNSDDYEPPAAHDLTKLNFGVKRPKRNPNSKHIYKKTKLVRVDPLDINFTDKDRASSEHQDLTNNLRGEESLEPGSLMIVSNAENNSTEPEFKIFMITADKKKVPIELSSDIVKNLAANAGNGVIPENHDIILGMENNYTIDEEIVEHNYTINEKEAECTITCDVVNSSIVSSGCAEPIISTESEHVIQSGGDILILPFD